MVQKVEGTKRVIGDSGTSCELVQHRSCVDGGIFREGVNVYVTYRKLPESCQHWCQAMKASIQKTCSWYAASGKCAILTGCTNFVDKNDIWSASCTPVILKFPINNTTGPKTLYFGINIQNSDISGPKNTSGIKILNSNFQVLTDGPAGFTKTTSVINDGNILLSSTGARRNRCFCFGLVLTSWRLQSFNKWKNSSALSICIRICGKPNNYCQGIHFCYQCDSFTRKWTNSIVSF